MTGRLTELHSLCEELSTQSNCPTFLDEKLILCLNGVESSAERNANHFQEFGCWGFCHICTCFLSVILLQIHPFGISNWPDSDRTFPVHILGTEQWVREVSHSQSVYECTEKTTIQEVCFPLCMMCADIHTRVHVYSPCNSTRRTEIGDGMCYLIACTLYCLR